ncbi:hypothetical protein SAMN05192534_1552 [Alteribacillus persepolensis]|uniref:Uncharacterized protein n=1 Tax=Alteribacillus persepolensis TaxID=568899 RepID=A0A1G8KL64_9BACI|nr:hypothetical protein SAMN05192534_1552 [Alteribacillus persepolensis]
MFYDKQIGPFLFLGKSGADSAIRNNVNVFLQAVQERGS